MNPLDAFPKVRNTLYLLQWLLSGALLVTTATVIVVTEGHVPVWLAATTAGFNAYTGFTGLTAQKNTVTTTDDEFAALHEDCEGE